MRSAMRLVVLAAMFGTLVPASSQAAPGATVVVVGSAAKVRPLDHPAGAPAPDGASLIAARNEFESFQVVVEAGGSALSGVSLQVTGALTGSGGSIPAGNVTIYREAYYDVTTVSDSEGATGRWPDALIPSVDPWFHQTRNAFPVGVPAGENRVAWVDVLVPQDAASGRYDGSLSVTAAGGIYVAVPIHLTVLNWTMPSTASLATAFGMDWDTPCLAHFNGDSCITHEADGWRMKALYAMAALDDRVTISYPQYQPINSSSERSLFEQYTLPLLNGTAATRLPGARLTSIQVDRGQWLKGWKAEANAKGFADRAFVYACDEPNTDGTAWDRCKQVAQSSQNRWPGVPILITGTIRNADRFGATSLIDILVPIVNEMHDKTGIGSPYVGNQRKKYEQYVSTPGNRLWTYTSCETEGCSGDSASDAYWVGWPGYPIDEPASEARAMGWQSFRYRTTGELYYAVDIDLTTAWTDQFDFGGNGDGTLFYPGRPGTCPVGCVGGTADIPIESMRLKLIRDGYEDYEYLAYLGAHGMRSQALAVVKGLFPVMYASAATDAHVRSARADLADLVAGLVGGPRP